MISKTISITVLAFAVLQVTQARMYCDCEIEYNGEDPDIVFTDFKQCTYREYESIRIEVESVECESSSSKYEEKQSVLKELEMARYQLEAFMCELNKSILKRMKEAYLKFGCSTSSEYQKCVAEILRETESEVQQHIKEFRNGFTKCKSFVGSIIGNISNRFKSKAKGIFGGKSSSSSRKFCDCDIEYSGEDPEIIINEIRKSTYKEYNSIKRELESMKCEESSPKYKEKLSICKELEMSRFQLEEYLCDLGVTVLERMKAAYTEHGGMVSSNFKSLIVEVLSETETQVKPYLMKFRKGFSRCRSFIGGGCRGMGSGGMGSGGMGSGGMGSGGMGSGGMGSGGMGSGGMGGGGSGSSGCKGSGGRGSGGSGGDGCKGSGGGDDGCKRRCIGGIGGIGCEGNSGSGGGGSGSGSSGSGGCKSSGGGGSGGGDGGCKRRCSSGSGGSNSGDGNGCGSSGSSGGSGSGGCKGSGGNGGSCKGSGGNGGCSKGSGGSDGGCKGSGGSDGGGCKGRSGDDDGCKRKRKCGSDGGCGDKDGGGSGGSGDDGNNCGGSSGHGDGGCKRRCGSGGEGMSMVSKTRKICEYDIEFGDEDTDIVLTEITQCAYREYINIKTELESAECDSSSSRYEEKQSLLKELEMARYRLEEYMSEKNKSILKRLEKAHMKFGSTTCSEYRSLIAQISSETESEVNQHITEFRSCFTKCNSFVSSIMGKISNKHKSMSSFKTGKFGGTSSSSTRKFCEYDVQYIGEDPEIIMNEIRMSTYKEYVSIKRELESMECEKSSSKYEEKMSMLKELESSRFRLEKYLCDMSVSMLERMKAAYIQHGGAVSPEFKSLIVKVLSEAETQVRPHLKEFREKYSRCRTFTGCGAVGAARLATRGMVGNVLKSAL